MMTQNDNDGREARARYYFDKGLAELADNRGGLGPESLLEYAASLCGEPDEGKQAAMWDCLFEWAGMYDDLRRLHPRQGLFGVKIAALR